MSKVKISYRQGNVAYCGSWSTQNFSENAPKGFLMWDTEKKESRFIELENPYSYITIRCKTLQEAQEHIDSNTYTPTNNIRFIIDEIITFAQNEQFSIACINKFDLKEKPLIISGEIKKDISQEHSDLGNSYTDIDFQTTYLRKYIESLGLGEEYVDQCINIHKQCCSEYNFLQNDAKTFSIKKLEFSYIGRFGQNNSIDFTKYAGVIGLFGENRIGKTSIIEAISYSIFGKTIKNITNSDFINMLQNSASTYIECELQGELYKIERTLKKVKSTSVKTTVQFEKFVNGNWESLNEEDVKLTNKSIERYFGSQENLLLSSIASQDEMLNFINSGQADRLKTLYNFIGLHFYEHLQKIAKSKYDDISKELEILSRTNNSALYSNLEDKKSACETLINNNEKVIESAKAKLSEIASKLENLTSTLVKPETTINIVELRNEVNNIDKEINKQKATKEQNEKIVSKNKGLVDSLKQEVKSLLKENKYEEITAQLPILQSLKTDLKNVTHKKELIQKEKNQSERAVEIINKHSWFETDDNCKQCTFLQDAWEHKDKLDKLTSELMTYESDLKSISDKLNEMQFTEDEIRTIQEKIVKAKELKAQYENADLQLKNIDGSIENLELKKKVAQDKIEANKEIIDLIESNKKLEDQITELSSLKIDSEKKIKTTEEELWKNKSEIAKIIGQMQNIEENLVTVIGLENKVKYYKIYIDATSKNGIPFEIISNILPHINKEINLILSQTQDWEIHFIVDKNNLDIRLVDSVNNETLYRPIEAGSGAERTITSFAIRLALIRMSYLPKANFFVIDEGFGSLDANNIMNIKDFLTYLKNYFQIVIVISHIPQIADMIDYQWQIELDNNYSFIKA